MRAPPPAERRRSSPPKSAGGLVVASDLRGRRIDLLAHTVRTTGAGRVRIVRADAAAGLPFPAVFDLVLLDAPCSGLGTLRRDPDIRWRRTEADLPALADAQLAMLMQAASAVRPRGRLVYSTCSSEPEENELVVARFLERRSDFSRADPGTLPALLQPFPRGGRSVADMALPRSPGGLLCRHAGEN